MSYHVEGPPGGRDLDALEVELEAAFAEMETALHSWADAIRGQDVDAPDRGQEQWLALQQVCRRHLPLLQETRAWAESLDTPAPVALSVFHLRSALRFYAEYALYVIEDEMFGPLGTFATAADDWAQFKGAALALRRP